MSIKNKLIGLFNNYLAESELNTLGNHISLPTFNLSTTSLRYLNKWYDRLEDITLKKSKNHPNYFSDPETIGLVTIKNGKYILTQSGKLFLKSKLRNYENAAGAEYSLISTLYYSGIHHSPKTDYYLSSKKQNLFSFLNNCINTTNSELLLSEPRLLVIAEYLNKFQGVLKNFLLLDSEDLIIINNLGSEGFINLFTETETPLGISKLTKKIGNDYTRASERRLHFLISILLNELKLNLIRNGKHFDILNIPKPFSNLISDSMLFNITSKFNYTDDIKIDFDESKYFIFLQPELISVEDEISIGTVKGKSPVSKSKKNLNRKGTGKSKKIKSRPTIINSAFGIEAENYVEKMILKKSFTKNLIRVGFTDLESIPLADGLLPGADFYISSTKSNTIGSHFIEIKSASNKIPNSIRFTRNEYLRAIHCNKCKILYEVYIVIYKLNSSKPQIYKWSDFADYAAKLSLEDLASLEVFVSLT